MFSHPDYLEYFIFVEVFEAGTADHFLVVLFCEEKACVFEALAVECVGELEDVADVFHTDQLSKYLLALLLEGVYSESVGQLEINDTLHYLQRAGRISGEARCGFGQSRCV